MFEPTEISTHSTHGTRKKTLVCTPTFTFNVFLLAVDIYKPLDQNTIMTGECGDILSVHQPITFICKTVLHSQLNISYILLNTYT